MTPDEYTAFKQTPVYETLMVMARNQIADFNELVDQLLELAYRYRAPGPDHVPYESRVANLAYGLRQSMHDSQIAGLAAVLLERLADLQVMDKGVPGEHGS